MKRMNEEVKQQIYDLMATHGVFDKEAWLLLVGMADDINADLHGVFE